MVAQDPSGKPDRRRGVYAISVAAELVGMGTQTLRLYERRGLLGPARSAGGTRRYSEDDLARLRRIGQLVGAGLNIAGVAAVLALESDNRALASDKQALESDNADLRARLAAQPQRGRRAAEA